MLAFLSPFLKELNQLYKSGFSWKAPNGEKIHSKLMVFNCIVDSVAKPLVQCIKQFNGYWGCGYCYHPGCVLDEGNNQAKYVMTNDDLMLMNDLSFEYTVDQKDKNGQHKLFHVKDRSNEEKRSDMKKAENLREDSPKFDIKGVKGMSSLFILTYFDVVFGFGIDWLHAVCLGVVKSVANLWFDSTSKDKPYYLSKTKRKLVNNNLSKLKLPAKLRRLKYRRQKSLER
ncbi:PREDICTED: uncharacterized protein LOC105570935 [Vollenhovia emeryi]|uniref:uncharacterized protein LOC105570935 n=1 Tax=Vollenhovia emeryi TaxID=411798 RepID=UPI0005F4E072|nr:PREDICTED: uncharacterized protein LOC105570935 [Vollenhovia emeryi]